MFEMLNIYKFMYLTWDLLDYFNFHYIFVFNLFILSHSYVGLHYTIYGAS